MNQAQFKALDSRITFSYQEELYRQINKLGYNYVSEYFYEQYYNKQKSAQQICSDLGFSKDACYHWMKTWSFKCRSRSETQLLRRKNEKESRPSKSSC